MIRTSPPHPIVTRTLLGFLVVAALVAPYRLSAQDAPPSDATLAEARERQTRGRGLLEAGDPNAALGEFERVYTLLEGHPRQYMVLSNIGRCYQTLGRYGRAMEYYQRYLDEAGSNAEDRVQVQASIDALDDLLGSIEVAANVENAEIWIDDRQVGTAPGPVRVSGGRHVVELRAPGHAPARREVELAARETVLVELSLERLGDGSGIDPGFFWSGFGVTAAAGVVTAIIGGVWWAQHDENAGRIADGTAAPPDIAAERDLALASDVLLGTTGALAIATAILGFVTQWESPEDAGPEARLEVAPLRGGLQVAVRGSFR